MQVCQDDSKSSIASWVSFCRWPSCSEQLLHHRPKTQIARFLGVLFSRGWVWCRSNLEWFVERDLHSFCLCGFLLLLESRILYQKAKGLRVSKQDAVQSCLLVSLRKCPFCFAAWILLTQQMKAVSLSLWLSQLHLDWDLRFHLQARSPSFDFLQRTSQIGLFVPLRDLRLYLP